MHPWCFKLGIDMPCGQPRQRQAVPHLPIFTASSFLNLQTHPLRRVDFDNKCPARSEEVRKSGCAHDNAVCFDIHMANLSEVHTSH